MDIGCIVLAGGKSTRLGRDKTAEIVGGKTLFERVICALKSLNSEIIVVKSTNSSTQKFYNYPKLKLVDDIYPQKGMSGGIYSGLVASSSFHNLVVASDMPFLNPELLYYMTDIAKAFDLVAHKRNNMFEPLHAVYSKNCLPFLKEIVQSNLRIIELLLHVKVRYLSIEEIERFDIQHLSIFNINTEKDLIKARKLASSSF